MTEVGIDACDSALMKVAKAECGMWTGTWKPNSSEIQKYVFQGGSHMCYFVF